MKWLLMLLLVLSMQRGFAVQELECKILQEISRSKKGFTQGFFISEGKLYESTGGYGSSLIRRIDLSTQKIEVSKRLPKHLFGEGLSAYGDDQMVQLTWKKGLGIIYDKKEINVQKTFRYQTEGWGITTAGDEMVMSDGSAKLYFLKPEIFSVLREVEVKKEGVPVRYLNELEWVKGSIYANVWRTNTILQIDPKTGGVLAEIDCKKLPRKKRFNPDAVLNGIAYDPKEDVFYITGKTWAKIFKVKFVPKKKEMR